MNRNDPEAQLHQLFRRLSSLSFEAEWFHNPDMTDAIDSIMMADSFYAGVGHSLSGGAEPNNHQVEMLLTNALEACENYFQAFQFVNWSGLNAREALDTVLFETEGTC